MAGNESSSMVRDAKKKYRFWLSAAVCPNVMRAISKLGNYDWASLSTKALMDIHRQHTDCQELEIFEIYGASDYAKEYIYKLCENA